MLKKRLDEQRHNRCDGGRNNCNGPIMPSILPGLLGVIIGLLFGIVYLLAQIV